MAQRVIKEKPQIELAKGITVGYYLNWEKEQNRDEISKFIFRRFTERYLDPVINSKTPNGFTIMAVCCLMIETLESFENGWPDTRKIEGKVVFTGFFNRYEQFASFRGYGERIYKNVRCGILHQAETTGGWTIKRDSYPTDLDNRIINADQFIEDLKSCLMEYCNKLARLDWESIEWINFRKKMNYIISNCG